MRATRFCLSVIDWRICVSFSGFSEIVTLISSHMPISSHALTLGAPRSDTLDEDALTLETGTGYAFFFFADLRYSVMGVAWFVRSKTDLYTTPTSTTLSNSCLKVGQVKVMVVCTNGD